MQNCELGCFLPHLRYCPYASPFTFGLPRTKIMLGNPTLLLSPHLWCRMQCWINSRNQCNSWYQVQADILQVKTEALEGKYIRKGQYAILESIQQGRLWPILSWWMSEGRGGFTRAPYECPDGRATLHPLPHLLLQGGISKHWASGFTDFPTSSR